MNEKPIERLKYYNGQRLEADDLKLEQEYHIRVRRWLNKSLYSAGIAQGLEVKPDLGNSQQVIVSPGLALDHEGREIILLEEQSIKVIGKPSTTEGQVDGNYLMIQYREETRAEEPGSCAPRGNGSNNGQSPSGGPSRVRATPIISWSNAFPHENSDKIVLAQVELSATCEVRNVYSYIRRYIGPTSVTTVRQYALEGERHIDEKNPGRIYFHIRGHQPNAVTLYLRAEKFSTLFYTEMGQHGHGLTIELNNLNVDTKHSHMLNIQEPKRVTVSNMRPNGQLTDHSHRITADVGQMRSNVEGTNWYALDLTSPTADNTSRDIVLTGEPPLGRVNMKVSGGAHDHAISGKTDDGSFKLDEPLSLKTKVLDPAGVMDQLARSIIVNDKETATALTYVKNLQVYIGNAGSAGVNRTEQILSQIITVQPGMGWLDLNGNGFLGDGGSTHPLVQKGTGAIRLDLISNDLSFPEGEYYIELRVESGGGRMLYNLYVE